MARNRPYIYMPVPAKTHHMSSKLEHHLGLADLYIRYGFPEIFEVEPVISEKYRPDVYMVKDDKHIIIEYQRTIITKATMQNKLDRFVESYNAGEHVCTELWIVSDFKYKDVSLPNPFTLKHKERTPTE